MGAAGLLDGRHATSYPGFLDPYDVHYSEDAVVQDGKIITSRGPGTAMDFSFVLIENLMGEDKRRSESAAPTTRRRIVPGLIGAEPVEPDQKSLRS